MLDTGCNNVSAHARLFDITSATKERDVVAVGRRWSEKDLPGFGADKCGHLLSRVFHSRTRLASQVVNRRRISPPLGLIWAHYRKHFVSHSGGGTVVQIDR